MEAETKPAPQKKARTKAQVPFTFDPNPAPATPRLSDRDRLEALARHDLPPKERDTHHAALMRSAAFQGLEQEAFLAAVHEQIAIVMGDREPAPARTESTAPTEPKTKPKARPVPSPAERAKKARDRKAAKPPVEPVEAVDPVEAVKAPETEPETVETVEAEEVETTVKPRKGQPTEKEATQAAQFWVMVGVEPTQEETSAEDEVEDEVGQDVAHADNYTRLCACTFRFLKANDVTCGLDGIWSWKPRFKDMQGRPVAPTRERITTEIAHEAAKLGINTGALNLILKKFEYTSEDRYYRDAERKFLLPKGATHKLEPEFSKVVEMAKLRFIGNPEFVAAVFEEIAWQAKRKYLGLPVLNPYLVNVYSEDEGTGKSKLAEAFAKPLDMMARQTFLSTVTDEKSIDIWGSFLLILDEMAPEHHTSMAALKRAITASEKGVRGMGTNRNHRVANRATFFGTSNHDTQTLFGVPGAKMRRYIQLSHVEGVRMEFWPEGQEVTNAIDWSAFWQNVDPNHDTQNPDSPIKRRGFAKDLLDHQAAMAPPRVVSPFEQWWRGLDENEPSFEDYLTQVDYRVPASALYALYEDCMVTQFKMRRGTYMTPDKFGKTIRPMAGQPGEPGAVADFPFRWDKGRNNNVYVWTGNPDDYDEDEDEPDAESKGA